MIQHYKFSTTVSKLFISSKPTSNFFSTKLFCYFKGTLILLFDQHACDERVRLENIIKNNLDENNNLVTELLAKPVKLKLRYNEFKNLMDLQSHILKFGNNLNNINFKISFHFFVCYLSVFPSWIRILNTDPDPEGKMNADPDAQPWRYTLYIPSKDRAPVPAPPPPCG